jgi:hypothetical protein
MQAALRPYVTAGIALVGASLIAATPVTPSIPGLTVEQPAVRLLASSIANIPVNLLITMANIPYYESLALQEYAYALGPAGTTGGVPGWIPPGATVQNGGVDPKTGQYTEGGTGSWWTESTDGNTWGWDNGNWPQLAAMGTAIFPSELALPIAQQLQTFAQAEFIAGERVNCEFECADVLGYLVGWLVFQTPLTALLSPEGTTFPDTVNAFPNIKPVWAGEDGAQLNPLGLAQVFADYFMQDPSDNPVMLPNLGDVVANSVQLGVDFQNDYNPLVPGSFLWWGAPTLYSVPALLAGLVQNFTGIPNQFVGIGQWTGAGGMPASAADAGPADLLTGLPAGFVYLAQGLLGYLNPGTYLGPDGVSLSNTLLRTLAEGSLPGLSDIARLLTGVDPASASTLAAGTPAGGSLLSGLLDNLSKLGSSGQGLPGLTSLTGGGPSTVTSTNNTLAPTSNSVMMDVAPSSSGKHAAPDPSLSPPAIDLPDQTSDTSGAVTDVVNTTPPGPATGKAVVAATPAHEASGNTVVRDSAKFQPSTGNNQGATSGGSSSPGATIGSVAKGIGQTVKNALGGASKSDGGQ